MAEDAQTPKPAALVPFVIARKSAIFFALWLGLTDLLFMILVILAFVNGYSTAANPGVVSIISQAFLLLFGISSLLKIIVDIVIAFTWVHDSYEIHADQVIHRTGIFTLKEIIFSCKNVQEVKLDQGLLGRIFNYGTVTLYNPILRDRFALENITDPRRYYEIIRAHISSLAGGSQIIIQDLGADDTDTTYHQS